MRRLPPIALIWAAFSPLTIASAQSEWTVPHRDRELVVDGFVEEWRGVPALVLKPGAKGVSVSGAFNPEIDDLQITIQGLWDEQSLYVAIQWNDDVWDIQEVRRRDAVYITADKRRRDRMLFFDNLSFQIAQLEYDYLLWFSPRIDDRGPFFWLRRLEGVRNREAATPAPVITPRQNGNLATLELQFNWKDLKLEPKKIRKTGLPVRWLAADSDSPEALLESKLGILKSLEWNGRLRLQSKP